MNEGSFITNLIIKLKLAKSEKQAQYVMLAIVALALVIAFVAWSSTGSGNAQNELPSPDELLQQQG